MEKVMELVMEFEELNRGIKTGNTRGWIGFSTPGEGKIHDIALVRREEDGRIANFVKSWMVTTGIS